MAVWIIVRQAYYLVVNASTSSAASFYPHIAEKICNYHAMSDTAHPASSQPKGAVLQSFNVFIDSNVMRLGSELRFFMARNKKSSVRAYQRYPRRQVISECHIYRTSRVLIQAVCCRFTQSARQA